MISAVEALQLPAAQLTVEEKAEVAAFIDKIDAAVRGPKEDGGIQRAGCAKILIPTLNPNIVAEIALTVKRFGWNPQWTPEKEPSALQGGKAAVVGWNLTLTPAEPAYDAVRALVEARSGGGSGGSGNKNGESRPRPAAGAVEQRSHKQRRLGR